MVSSNDKYSFDKDESLGNWKIGAHADCSWIHCETDEIEHETKKRSRSKQPEHSEHDGRYNNDARVRIMGSCETAASLPIDLSYGRVASNFTSRF